jgi:hypothetical protein
MVTKVPKDVVLDARRIAKESDIPRERPGRIVVGPSVSEGNARQFDPMTLALYISGNDRRGPIFFDISTDAKRFMYQLGTTHKRGTVFITHNHPDHMATFSVDAKCLVVTPDIFNTLIEDIYIAKKTVCMDPRSDAEATLDELLKKDIRERKVRCLDLGDYVVTAIRSSHPVKKWEEHRSIPCFTGNCYLIRPKKKGECGIFINGDSPFLDPDKIYVFADEFKNRSWKNDERVAPVLREIGKISEEQRSSLKCVKGKVWAVWSGLCQEINYEEFRDFYKLPDRFKLGSVPNAIEAAKFIRSFNITGLCREELDFRHGDGMTLHEMSCGQLREAAKGQVNSTYSLHQAQPFRGLELNPDGTLISDFGYIF